MTAYALTRAGALSLTDSPDGLRLTSPYDPGFLTAMKMAIPASARRWDGQRKQWIIDPAHGAALVREISTFYGVALALPGGAAAPPQSLTEIIQLAYLGGCREREDKTISASGYTLGNRNAKAPDLVFPEAALKAWFDGEGGISGAETSRAQPAPPASLYRVLCVPADVDTPALKTAYRRMARQTHPDVNKEPDAAEQFRRVQAAYDVLSDPLRRRKYDAGLKLEALAKREQEQEQRSRPLETSVGALAAHLSALYGREYRAPLRCGLLLVTGVRRLGRVHVERVLSWQDLIQGGRVLVSSWPQDATVWREDWVTP